MQVSGQPAFSQELSWAWITGSTNHNVINHATSDVHKGAMTRKRADAVKASGGSVALSNQALLIDARQHNPSANGEEIRPVFHDGKVEHHVRKVSSYKLELEKCYEVDIGHAYNTTDSQNFIAVPGFSKCCS